LRGLHKVNIEGMVIAAGQNLKRLLNHRLDELFYFVQKLISQLIPAESLLFQQPEDLCEI
jgi:hypothetical protein